MKINLNIYLKFFDTSQKLCDIVFEKKEKWLQIGVAYLEKVIYKVSGSEKARIY